MDLVKLTVVEVNIHQAKTHLSRLIERALQGEEVIIAKAGKPVVKLVRIRPAGNRRVFGSAAGTVWFAEGWDAPLTDAELQEFLGR
jgi:prevent-host-death family protein